MYRRFFAGTILKVFEAISRLDEKDATKARRKRRAINRMGGYSYPRNGTQECDRRRYQIEAGQLKKENGLDVG